MKIFLAGASGAIGRRLVPQLVARGHSVVGTTTHPAKLDELAALGAQPVVMDGLDPASVGEAVGRAEPDVVIHQMTALASMRSLRHFDRVFARTNRLRTEGTDHLLAAARAASVDRFIVQSYTGWNNPTGRGPATEDVALDASPLPQQRETAAAIAYLEQRVTAAGGIVLRYGSFYGPGASEEMVKLVQQRKWPIIGNGDGVWSWIHLDDAASATIAAIEQGAGIYNIVDDEPAPVREWLPYLAETIGAKAPMHVPVWLGKAMAGNVVVRMMTEGSGSSNAKAKRDLGWELRYPSWRDGFVHGLVDEPGARAA